MKKKLIERVTVGSGGAASITFSDIPAGYSDLLVKVSARSTRADTQDWYVIKFNTSSASFSGRNLYSVVGSGVFSNTNLQIFIPSANSTSSTFGNGAIYLPNYASSANKSFSVDSVTENNATSAIPYLLAGLWSNTSAINEIELDCINGNFVEFSSASLYGIVRGSDGTTTVS